MLTHRRDAFRGKATKQGTIQHVRYGFLFVCYGNFVRKTHHFEIFIFEKYRDLGLWVTEMTLFDTLPMTSI